MQLQEILIQDDVVESINKNMEELTRLISEINYMIGFDQKHPHHHLDVWEHTLYAISLSKNDFDIRLALLLHDIGKPFSYQEGEVRHYKNHPKVSAYIAKLILNRLDYKEDYIDKICYLIEKHDTPILDYDIKTKYDLSLKLYEIQRCDALAHHPDKLEKRKEYLNNIDSKIKLFKSKE